MSINKKELNHISELAKLTFSEKEKEVVIKDLNKVLKYIDILNEIDTEDMELLVDENNVDNVFREDIEEESLDIKKVLKNAPEVLKEYILVPKVIK